MRLFFTTHCSGIAPNWIVKTCLLADLPAALDDFNLAFDLIMQCLFNETERIDVLEFGSSAQLFLSLRTYRHIGIATERALLHVAVTDIEIADQGV